jgi:hypothetical protein
VTPLLVPKLLAAPHAASIDDDCFEHAAQAFELASGETRRVHFKLRPVLGTVNVEVTDEHGAPVRGQMVVDGVPFGPVPGPVRVPVCAGVLRVEAGGAVVERRVALAGGKEVSLNLRLPVARCEQAASRRRLVSWGGLSGLALTAVGFGGAALVQGSLRDAAPGSAGIDSKIAAGKGLNTAGLIGVGVALAGAAGFLFWPNPADACEAR